MTEYKVGSLFAGVGGICLGFKNAKTKKSTQGEYNILYYEYEIVSYEEWKKARKPFYF